MTDTISSNSLSEEFLTAAKDILGPKGFSQDPEDMASFISDWRGRGAGHTPLVAKPASTQEVSEFMALCAKHKVAVTPQGGNSGLVKGGLPFGEVLLSLKRMRAIREIDPLNDSLTVEAGVILTEAQDAADDVNRLFPLSLAAEGVAQIGGLISTNAGGVAVLRYGMMRDLVLGLEVVLPDGRIWNGLTGLRKDNTAYDLKQLFIGAEGTLGVVTAATLKLFPKPAVREVAWIPVSSPKQAVELLALTKHETGGAVSSFELMPNFAVDIVKLIQPDTRDPLPSEEPWRVLLEVSFARREGAREVMEAVLSKALEEELISDAVLAENETQAAAIWNIRESLPLGERTFGQAAKHDISVPVSAIPEFIERSEQVVKAASPGSTVVAFGHVGDGNLHYNVTAPPEVDNDEFVEAEGPALAKAIHDLVCEMNGSISAEHGIGLQKRDELAERVGPVELDMLHAVKRALDPDNRMNPERVVKV